jgi:phosphate transport system permease protein
MHGTWNTPLDNGRRGPIAVQDNGHGAEATVANNGPSAVRAYLNGRSDSAVKDRLFKLLMQASALTIFIIVLFVLGELAWQSRTTLARYGVSFFYRSSWDPVNGDFGARPFIYGTVVSSLLALLVATPLAIGTAVFITEMCPLFLRRPLTFLTELLAAIPSVIYGLWALMVLVPLLRNYLDPVLMKTLGWTGLFEGPDYGVSMLAAALVLSIMVLPIISSITREVLNTVPQSQREAALALGATRWEMVRMGVLPNARLGIVGGTILGLGRALGETMAVTMVIGNRPEIAHSLLAPGYTMASVLANEFTEATTDLYLSALIEIGLGLFLVTVIVNALARLLVWSVTRGVPARTV